MSKVKISLTIDQAVLDRVDEAAWGSRRSRSAYVEDVLDGSVPPLPGGVLAEGAAGSVMPKAAGAGDSAHAQVASSASSWSGPDPRVKR